MFSTTTDPATYWVHVRGKRVASLGLVNHSFLLRQILVEKPIADLNEIRLVPANDLEKSLKGRLSWQGYVQVMRFMKHPIMQLLRTVGFVLGLALWLLHQIQHLLA